MTDMQVRLHFAILSFLSFSRLGDLFVMHLRQSMQLMERLR